MSRFRNPRRARRAVAALCAGIAAVALALVPVVGATAAPAASPPLQYVALGDSYSAGFGIVPFTELPAPGCYQAEQNYPHLVAETLGLDLDDRTCSGAVTANIRNTPQPTITGQGTAPVQADSLGADTDIVTVTIGGNDLGFADVATSCVALSPTGPTLTGFTTCKEFYAPVIGGYEDDRLQQKLDTVVAPALQETFELITQKAPNARVFVVGYPTIAPDVLNTPAEGCFTDAFGNGTPPFPQNAFPYTATDTEYLHGTEARLDAAIRTAAEANGATYLSTLKQTAANSACATGGSAFVNGVSLVTDGNGTPTPDPDIDVKLGALHPNTSGVAFLAATVSAAIGTGTDPGDDDTVGEDPTAPAPNPDDSVNAPAAERPSGSTPRELAATGAEWQGRFALLATAGLAVLLGIAAIVARLELRSRRGSRS